MSAPATLQNKAFDIGIPVKTVMNGTLIKGRDGAGAECLYGVMTQNTDHHGTFLLRIDCRSGQTARFDFPQEMGNGPMIWSERWNRMFIYASAGMHGLGRLYEFDPVAEATHCRGRVHPVAACLAVSIDEAPDGTLYLGSYGEGCRLNSYNPATGQFRDLGVACADELTSKFLPKKLVAQYLALCPLCAAKYDEFVKTDDEVMAELRDRIVSSDLCEIPISLGDEKTSIRFVETHLHDLKVIMDGAG